SLTDFGSTTVAGQPVTLQATVSNTSGTSATPFGTVQFQVNGVNFGSAAPLSGGVASISVPNNLIPASGSAYSFTAVYNPGTDGFGFVDFKGSSATIFHTVNKANTTTALAALPASPASPGTNVTFTATISPVSPGTTAAGQIGGTATFYLD